MSHGGGAIYRIDAVPPTISGNAGVAGATLSYFDGVGKTATSAGDGSYSFTVPIGWSGSVTPSKTDFTFTPDHRDYAGLIADQTRQDYAPAPAPMQIAALYPADGSQVCPRPQVGVDLEFAAQVPTIESGGPLTDLLSFDQSTILLTLDGNDVTADAVQTMPFSYPALFSVLYLPTTDLAPGVHDAALTYITLTGPQSRTWNFAVATIGCGTFYSVPGGTVDSVP